MSTLSCIRYVCFDYEQNNLMFYTNKQHIPKEIYEDEYRYSLFCDNIRLFMRIEDDYGDMMKPIVSNEAYLNEINIVTQRYDQILFCEESFTIGKHRLKIISCHMNERKKISMYEIIDEI